MSERTSTLEWHMSEHFSAVAEHYRELRDLDEHTARCVASLITELAKRGRALRLLDVGAGTGRYTEAVVEIAAAEHEAVSDCVAYDANRVMVGSVEPAGPEVEGQFSRAVGLAEALPFRDGAFDALLSFNAVHHFGLDEFLGEAARVLQNDGLLIVYTRTPEQNEATVWGRLFPMFAERETRLHTENELLAALIQRSEFRQVCLRRMRWTVNTTVDRLIEQVRGRHYSTFRFYSPWEFEEALATFEERLARLSSDGRTITVENDHLLLSARRG